MSLTIDAYEDPTLVPPACHPHGLTIELHSTVTQRLAADAHRGMSAASAADIGALEGAEVWHYVWKDVGPGWGIERSRAVTHRRAAI